MRQKYELHQLIGATGTVTRNIKIIDAMKAQDDTIDILVQDNMGNEYWTELDDDISID